MLIPRVSLVFVFADQHVPWPSRLFANVRVGKRARHRSCVVGRV